MISVIIPTYKAVKHLDVCLQSFLLTSEYDTDEAIVVVDNTVEENKTVFEKYKAETKIKFIIKEQRSGMCISQNIGASVAKNAKILVINDDMVFPYHWSSTLNATLTSYNQVVSCPLIERNRSTWSTVHAKDFGTIDNFDLQAFLSDSNTVYVNSASNFTMPFAIFKSSYLAVNGWDEHYEHGMLADTDFAFRLINLLKFEFRFCNTLNFYHFSMSSVNDKNLISNKLASRTDAEHRAKQYYEFKFANLKG